MMTGLNDLFKKELKVLNIGLKGFSKSIKESGGDAVQMNWTPPAGGDPELMDIISRIKRSSRKQDKE